MLLLKATTESLQVTNAVAGTFATLKGSAYASQSSVVNQVSISPNSNISPGDWMIIVLGTYSGVGTVTNPTGWTVLQAATTAGTQITTIYAKNYVAGETSYVIPISGGYASCNITLLWGSGAAPIANWILGTNMLRANIVPTTAINNVAPSITTTVANTLVLAISTERTAAAESGVASVTGATQWFYGGQLGSIQIDSTSVSYIQQAAAAATSNVTIAYVNSQASNGMAIQIGIPPSTGNVDYSVSYTDTTSSTTQLSSNEGKLAYSTTTQLVAPPAASTDRLIKLITLTNTDLSISNTVLVQKNINGVTYNVGSTVTLLPGEMLQYMDKRGWKHYGSSGVIAADLTASNSSNNQLQYNNGSNVLDNVTSPIAFTITRQTASAVQSWNAVTMSSDGTHIFATINNYYVDVSADGGATWTVQSSGLSTQDWTGIASSADGTHVVAINFGNNIYTSTNSGVTWTAQTGSGSLNWLEVASSADGTKLAATVQNGSVYTSPDSGVTWTAQTGSPSIDWAALASSSDGTKLVGAGTANYIYTSPDSGVTWTQRATAQNWQAITSSADGTKLAAIVNPGFIYTSSNSGVTWTQRATSQAWGAISSSSDGTKLIAAVNPGYLYTSIDSGVTWTAQTSAGSQTWGNVTLSADGTKFTVSQDYIYTGSMALQLNPTWSKTLNGSTLPAVQSNFTYSAWTQQTGSTSQVWSAMASSSDGTMLAATVHSGYIYTSTNSGVTWTQQTGSGSLSWSAMASSSDGSRLAATNTSNGYIYTSPDFGVTWTQQTGSTSQVWSAIASSADGLYLAAANTSNGYIYTSPDYGVTWTQRTGATSQVWSVITSSSDGTHLVVANTSNGYIYTSTNTGVTWTQTSAPSEVWSGLASSADGTKLAAANTSNGFIYTSIDAGVTWIKTAAPSLVWSALVSSSDGTHLAAANTSNGYIYTDVISLGYSPINTSASVPVTTTASNGVYPVAQGFAQQPGSGSVNWLYITSSADGTKLAAVTASNYIYTSPDSGFTWTQQTSSTLQYWAGITSSADGTKLAAVTAYLNIYTSTNSGVTWTQQTGSAAVNWNWITSSSDGTRLAAVVYGGYIYTSTNSGVTWTQQTGSGSLNWYGIASSADGTKLAATVSPGYIYTSTNSGVTWTQQTGSGSLAWRYITSSADGTKLAAIVYGGYIYTSTNSGVTWTQQTSAGSQNWYNITSSADGTKLAAVVAGGNIYTSTNSGVTWTVAAGSTIQNWYGIASSADGTKLAASVAGGGYIYTSVIPQTETSTLALPGGNAKLALSAWTADPSGPPQVSAVGAVGSYVSATTTAAIPVPAGVVAGSLIVVFVYANWPNSPNFPTAITPASGFYLAGSWPYQDTTYSKYNATAWYYKYATGHDTGTYNFVINTDSLGGTAQYGNGYAHIIKNGPTSGNPFVDTVLFGAAPAAATYMTIGTFTPQANNSLLLAGVGWDYDGGAGSAVLGFPSGWGSIAQYDDTSHTVLFGTGYSVQSTAAATGSLNFTTNMTSPGNVILMTIRPAATTTSYSVASNTIAAYARTTANNSTVAVLDASLSPMNLQASLWQHNVMSWTPGPTNVGAWVGTSGVNVNSGGGTTLSTLPTLTTPYTAMRRTSIATAVTTTNQQVGLRSELMYFLGGSSSMGGFFFSSRFGFDAIAAGCRAFVGFTTTTTITTTDPSTLTNILGFGFDLADTAWSFYHNGASGTATKEPIPGQGILATNNTGYDAYIWSPPGSTTVYYRLDRTDTGATLVDSSVSTNLPVNTTLMLATVMMSNGTANTTVGAATLGINRIYVETIR